MNLLRSADSDVGFDSLHPDHVERLTGLDADPKETTAFHETVSLVEPYAAVVV